MSYQGYITLDDKNIHLFSMFCDLCVTQMVHLRLKSILVLTKNHIKRLPLESPEMTIS